MLRSIARLAEVGAKRSRGGRMLATHAAKRLAVPAAPTMQLVTATPSRCRISRCSSASRSDVSPDARSCPACSCAWAPPPFRRLLILQAWRRASPAAGRWETRSDGSERLVCSRARASAPAAPFVEGHEGGINKDGTSRGGRGIKTRRRAAQEAEADRHEQEQEQEQDKHAQDKHEQELSSSGRQWRPTNYW
jgi:hypothetical protein